MTNIMNQQGQIEDIPAFNENSLQELNWAIESSGGEFSLILAHCNSASLRQRLTQKLQASCRVEIREIILDQPVTTLYTTIQAELGNEHPEALIVSGLESVKAIDSMLTGANQVREEFRKNFPFPVVLWVTDEVLQKLIRLAPDLQSWTTAVEFAIPTEDLIQCIQQTADEVFAKVLEVGAGRFLDNTALNLGIGSPRRTELELARVELQNRGVTLHPEIESSLEFVLGRDARGSMEQSRQHYERSLAILEKAAQEDKQTAEGTSPHLPIAPQAHSVGTSSPPSPHSPLPTLLERRACLLYCMGLWWRTYAVLHHTESDRARATAKDYFQECITVFDQANREDLVANFINGLGAVLQRMHCWDELEAVARRAISLHQTYPHPFRLARAYGFLAEVALAKSAWKEAQESAQQALAILDNAASTAENSVSCETIADLEWEQSSHRGWYLFALARAQIALGEKTEAIATLETAKVQTKAQYEPELYIHILSELRDCYFKEAEYLKAFNIKLELRSNEQTYGIRAFTGAGRLQPKQQVTNPALALVEQQETVAQEIAATGREQDIKRLVERVARPDHKLTIIYGQSGVGKSSILQAGLIPVLKHKAIGTRDVVPVLQQVYPDWIRELGDRLAEALPERRTSPPTPPLVGEGRQTPPFPAREGGLGGLGLSDTKSFTSNLLPINGEGAGDGVSAILNQLETNADNELLTVLIFDQFEEFFFVYKDPKQRLTFYNFLRECLDVPHVRVILSLREDYLYYLLECNDRLTNLEVINNNILDKDILYYLGNFSREDTKALIESFTHTTKLLLEPELIDLLVEDLAGDFGEIRPIELQVVGTQLQTEKILTLAQYQKHGPKEELVGKFLEEVVKDCGIENEQIAKLVLYLLTDENNTRPLKTRADLELELEVKSETLDLVLLILVKSGLVFKVPAVPADRYQLVHDYLVPFVRQQQSERLIAELEKEREQRKLTEAKLNEVLKQKLKTARRSAITLASLLVLICGVATLATTVGINTYLTSLTLDSEKKSELDRVVSALKVAKQFKQLSIAAIPETRLRVLRELNQAVYGVTERNRLEGHTESVTSVSFSRDGKLLASGSEDKTVKLWDLDSRKDVKTFSKHTGSVTNVSFSPDGKIIASASKDKTVKLWSLNGTLLKNLKHDDGVISVIFSPDGKMIATACEDKTVKLWSIDGTLLKNLKHDDSVITISFAPNSKMLATASNDDTIKIWNIDGIKIQTINNYGAIDIKFSSEGHIIATNKDHKVKYYDRDGNLLKTSLFSRSPSLSNLISSTFHSDGNLLAVVEPSSNRDNRILILNTKQLYFNREFPGHSDKINYLSFSPNGKLLASASKDKTVKLWNIDSKLSNLTEYGISEVRFNPDGKTVMTASNDNKVQFWKRDATFPKNFQKYGSQPSFSPDGKTIFTTSADKIVKRLLTLDGREIQLFNEHGDSVSEISFSPDSKIIAAPNGDSTISLWRSDGNLIKTLKGHTDKVTDITFSPDSKIIASIGNDNVVKLWKNNGTLIKTLGHTGHIKGVMFSSDSKILASIDNSNVAKIWRNNGTFLKTLEEPIEGVENITFSPDSKMIITSSGDNEEVNLLNSDGTKITTLKGQIVKLWRSDGTLVKTLNGHLDGVKNMTFSPDGKIIASTGDDNIVKLWHSNGTLIKTLQRHTDSVTSVIFSPNGRIIASLSSNANNAFFSSNAENSMINLWRSNDGTLIKSIDNYGINSIKFSSDSTIIASINKDKTIKLLSSNGTLRTVLKEHNDKITNLSFSKDSKLIASISQDNTMRLWNLDRKQKSIRRGYSSEKKCYFIPEYCQVNLSSDGKIITAVTTSVRSEDNKSIYTLQMWTIDDKKPQTLKELSDVHFSKDGKLIASVSEDIKSNYTVKFWNGEGKQVKSFSALKASSFSFSPDGRTVAVTTNKNYSVQLWSTDEMLTTINGHSDQINSASLSPDGKTIASSSSDNTIKLWTREGVLLRTLKGHTDKVNSVIFSPDGKTIASASDDTTVKLWNLEGKEIKTLKGHKDKVKRVIFSPNGKIIASASDDKTINLWKSSADSPFQTLEGVSNQKISFSSDSNILTVSSAEYGNVKLYFLNSIWFKDTEFSDSQYHDVGFSPDGKAIALASDNGVSVLSWDLDDLLVRGCNWARDYLKNNPKAKGDRTLCDDIK
ncbi:WD-40 repeat-containing protein [Kalymmatonema gypsitolerans NIES-4073]|nr:WD-40 repeat-containing protein [Scytonema sp. NIES-4073]